MWTEARTEPRGRTERARRERQIHQLRYRPRTMLCIAFFVLAASLSLRIRDSDAVTLPGFGLQLPPLCGSRALFNVECPGCGLTRSFIALASGDLQQSFQFHRLGWLLALAIVGQFPYRVYSQWELRRNKIVERLWPVWFGYFLIAALIVNWLLKMSGR